MKPCLSLVLCLIPLMGCSTDPNHLGNPLTWPASALNTGLNNAFYNARRDRVEAYVQDNQSRILANVVANGGAFLDQAAFLAHVRPPRRAELLRALQADLPLYGRDAEAMVVAFMVHGDPRPAPRTATNPAQP